LERSLSIGDLITVDKFSGRVEEIRTRYTVLRSQDGTESVIPNEMLVSSPVVNFSMCNPDLRVNLTAIMAPDVDIDTLFPQLEQAVGAVAGVLANPAPEALLIQLGTESLSLEMVFWVAATDKIKLPSISSAANRAMYKLLPPTLLKAVSGA
ncbi:MAG: mechanosensitive ion channel domain-containing protein, partial [Burkholderiaceae bacterium]